ncbi:MAG: transcriptional regulator [Candidatus Asgardarchaeia archaeon]
MDEDLKVEIIKLKERIDRLESYLKNKALTELTSKATLSVLKILSLPEHLRMTAGTVVQLGRATAGEVAETTGRERTLESSYLNELVRLGHLKKINIGRKVYYEVSYAVK